MSKTPKTPFPVARSVSIESPESKKPLCTLLDNGDGTLKLEIFYQNTGASAGWVHLKRETLLNMFVSLFPDNVAYQFDTEES